MLSEKVNQLNLSELKLDKLTKAQLVQVMSSVISQLELIDRFVEDADEQYEATNLSYYSHRGDGLKTARKYVTEAIEQSLYILGVSK